MPSRRARETRPIRSYLVLKEQDAREFAAAKLPKANLPYRGQDGACGRYRVAVQASSYTKIAQNDAGALDFALG